MSSPTAASTPGAVTRWRPRLIAFWRKIRAKLWATIVSSCPLSAETACSRDDPQPKFFPATMMLPAGTRPHWRAALNSTLSANANCGRLGRKHRRHEAPGIDDIRRNIIGELSIRRAAIVSAPFRGSVMTPVERRGRGNGGGTEIDIGGGISHASLEVPVRRGERGLTVARARPGEHRGRGRNPGSSRPRRPP